MSDTYSQADSNFNDSMSGGVDPRTGVFSANMTIAELTANGTAGPNFKLVLRYDPNSQSDEGFGKGWGFSWSRYSEPTNTIFLATGEKYSMEMQGEDLVLKDQKIKSAEVTQASGYQIKHRQGEIHVLDKQVQDNIVLPSRIATASGLGINLEWTQNCELLSISDEIGLNNSPETLVRIDYSNEYQPVIYLWEGSDEARTVSFVIGGEQQLQTITIAGGGATNVWQMDYDDAIQNFGAHPLKQITFPSGAVESVQYIDQGHAYPDVYQPGVYVPYVQSYTKQIKGIDQVRHVSYQYSNKNFLGYDSSIPQWDFKSDNLYSAESDYEYTTTIINIDDNGNKTITVNTYNKFHLLISSSVKTNNKEYVTENTYDICDGDFNSQVNHFQMPIKVA